MRANVLALAAVARVQPGTYVVRLRSADACCEADVVRHFVVVR